MGKNYHKIQSIYKRDGKGKFTPEYSLPEFELLKNIKWSWTEKVDGMCLNTRVNIEESIINHQGKTDRAIIPDELHNNLNKFFKSRLHLICDVFNQSNIEFLMEGYGPKIQNGGGNYRDTQGFVLFDIKVNYNFLDRGDVEGIANMLSMDIIPIVGYGSLNEAIEYVKSGFNSTWGLFEAEGLVLRPSIELKRRNGGRIITKIKHKDFIL